MFQANQSIRNRRLSLNSSPLYVERTFRPEDMRSCTVSAGGGMMGGYSGMYLHREKDGTAVLEVTSREYHSAREVKTGYPMDEAVFEELCQAIRTYSLYSASRQKAHSFQVMDGETETISFSFNDASFRISDTQRLSRKMMEGFGRVRAILNEYRIGEGITTVEPQSGYIHLSSGYTLNFYVEEAFENAIENLAVQDFETSRAEDWGVAVAAGEIPVSDGSEALAAADAGDLIYDPASQQLILLYEEHDFTSDVYRIGYLTNRYNTTFELLREFEGTCSISFN